MAVFLSSLAFAPGLQFTAVNCFVSGFNIKDGRADTTALVIDTDQMSVIGDGEIDLKTERLNLAFARPSKGEPELAGRTG